MNGHPAFQLNLALDLFQGHAVVVDQIKIEDNPRKLGLDDNGVVLSWYVPLTE